MGEQVPRGLAELARGSRTVTVLSGAGMSAESGVPTFRDAQSGLWERYDAAALATPEAWLADAALVWGWYQWRRSLVRACEPNAGHRALARWARLADVRIVTQNVDDLHERAGSAVLAHLHGDLFASRCDTCGQEAHGAEPGPEVAQDGRTPPPRCECGGLVRPGVVWFGEALPPDAFEAGMRSVLDSHLVVVVGTSGLVQPAALLPDIALRSGIPVVEINPGPTPLSTDVDVSWRAPAAVALPALIEALG